MAVAESTLSAAQPPLPTALAGRGRRLGGELLEILLLSLGCVAGGVVYGVNDGVSAPALIAACLSGWAIWLVWLLLVAHRGQAPGKHLLGLYVIRANGAVAGFRYMLLRELAIKTGVFWVLGLSLTATLGAAGYWIALCAYPLAALWCVWDADRQCLWDKALGTRVIHPASIQRAPASGLSADQFEERRQRELERL